MKAGRPLRMRALAAGLFLLLAGPVPASETGAPDPETAARLVREKAFPFSGADADYDLLMSWIGDAGIVLLGECTHGTREFYEARAEITRRLVREKGFNLVVFEANWPGSALANRFIQGRQPGMTPLEALSGFADYPAWMWRNPVILELVADLGKRNAEVAGGGGRAALHGMDLYGSRRAAEDLITYLSGSAPGLAGAVGARYACFDAFGWDLHAYGRALAEDPARSCEYAAADTFSDVSESALAFLASGRPSAHEDYLEALQNARVVKGAEAYFRTLYREGETAAWNLRDAFMMESLEAFMRFVEEGGRAARAVVWAHNSHLGNAAATSVHSQGEINLGQLLKEKYGMGVVSIGLFTHAGWVTASSAWDGPAECRVLNPAHPESVSGLFHRAGIPAFLLRWDLYPDLAGALLEERLERTVGAIYLPEDEMNSHYRVSRPAAEFDAVLFVDETRALQPLDGGLACPGPPAMNPAGKEAP